MKNVNKPHIHAYIIFSKPAQLQYDNTNSKTNAYIWKLTLFLAFLNCFVEVKAYIINQLERKLLFLYQEKSPPLKHSSFLFWSSVSVYRQTRSICPHSTKSIQYTKENVTDWPALKLVLNMVWKEKIDIFPQLIFVNNQN